MKPDRMSAQETTQLSKRPAGWPKPMGEKAYHGLAGELVNLIAPETEASQELLLVSFLVAFGNWIGRGPCRLVEDTKHHTNEFALMIGETSVGRKGTGWDRIRKFFSVADGLSKDNWTECVRSGLSSGEGLILQAAAADKRVMIVEPEFARALISSYREGNTLSAVVRNAWESGDLNIMTKNMLRATDAHISIIGHITADELKRQLKQVEVANGFANRFLFVAVRRSKELPFGGRQLDYTPLARELVEVRQNVRQFSALKFSRLAEDTWRGEYPQLTASQEGLLGSVTNRGAPHVLRLALIFALLDRKMTITRSHLEAALEVWRYCKDSAAFLFGNALGDPIADRIYDALQKAPNGISRTNISGMFKRNVSSEEIDHALLVLKMKKLANAERQLKIGAGRPAEQWYAIK